MSHSHSVATMVFRASTLVAGAVAADPTMNFLSSADCGGSELDINKDGIFKLSVSVTGKSGFTHDCSTEYDPAVGVAAGSCVEWLPAKVLSDEEGLDITLQALDADGKQATCMKWELAFDGEGREEAWAPTDALPTTMEQAMLAAQKLVPGDSYATIVTSGENTKATRHQAMYDNLDSMTHMSHRCVKKGEPLYWDGSAAVAPDWAFPPTGGQSVLHMRLSHALLAATGTIWSIDRSCRDFLPGGFCVPHIDGLPDPHCHTVCSQTWALGPGGVASWGISTFTHHLPSPGIALIQQSDAAIKQHNDKGCGDDRHAVI